MNYRGTLACAEIGTNETLKNLTVQYFHDSFIYFYQNPINNFLKICVKGR